MSVLFAHKPPKFGPLRDAIIDAYRMDEDTHVNFLLSQAQVDKAAQARIQKTATKLVENVREKRLGSGGIDSFLYQYSLSSEEGIALMCMAEALSRIPDPDTVDDLIRDKIASANWQEHRGQSDSTFVNAATWGLMLTGKILSPSEAVQQSRGLPTVFKKLVERGGEPVIRKAIQQAMKILGRQFVMGATIEDAMKRARDNEKNGYRYSYDMLGEAAKTQADADRYFAAYERAIKKIASKSKTKNFIESPGISVKLSALHPRYEFAQRERVLKELTPRLLILAQQAKAADIGLTVDAEEADRLDISLDIIEAVFNDASLADWEGFGLALQSYQKRAWYVIDWLAALAKRANKRFMVRLIKGAYWDSEIKWAQELGLRGYPVFTRKGSTDVSFLACAKKILSMPEAFYPQFATHNAHSVASILEFVGDRKDYEFQCLHGMGETLYDQITDEKSYHIPCRIYAPVGSHEELLPYLVRRLLENGANTSFINRIVDADSPIEAIIADPIAKIAAHEHKPHPKIPLPLDLYQGYRGNSRGVDLSDPHQLQSLDEKLAASSAKAWQAGPIVGGVEHFDDPQPALSPNDNKQTIGQVSLADDKLAEKAITLATAAKVSWSKISVLERAACLQRTAQLLEKHRADFMALAIHEGGKTIADAVAEVREAIDFCYYYATQAKKLVQTPMALPGPTGEHNQLSLHGRGVVACISPWNFPLAIFIGQVTAGLAAGNCVIAKPAKQTPLIAALAVRLLHAAGIPDDVLHFLPGPGRTIGNKLVEDERINAIMLTGSTETARMINQKLAARQGPIVPLIAETGGQNAMIVDSSALPEQVVTDVVTSAFGSAGQRCSALRVLFVQDDIASRLIEMLKGAMAELVVAPSAKLSTDVGPIIDEGARAGLAEHAKRMEKEAKLIYEVSLDEKCKAGSFFAPRAFELKSLSQLTEEQFGPILHVIRFQGDDLDQVIAAINQTGFGLTLGIHSRIDERVAYIAENVHVGNCYVNRNMIGAVVGVQPFGGENLSGTGPKAGGPHYLLRLCHERTLTINTAAAGGNASLMSLSED